MSNYKRSDPLYYNVHDPLAKIKMYCHIIKKTLMENEEPNETLLKAVEAINLNCNKVFKETVNMFDIVDGDSPVLNARRIDMAAFITTLSGVVKACLHDVSFTINVVNEAKNSLCDFDGTRMQNVFLNIINNSIRFNPDKDDLVIDFIISDPVEGYINVTVKDNGVGAENDQGFFNAMNHENLQMMTATVGSRLGLHSVFNAVKTHQGCVSVETAPGKGFAIKIVLPREQQRELYLREKDLPFIHDPETIDIMLSDIIVKQL